MDSYEGTTALGGYSDPLSMARGILGIGEDEYDPRLEGLVALLSSQGQPEAQEFAAGGGIAGLGPREYRAGGRYLSGPGDGMSDNIKANIDGMQEARLADGEFVIPADVVSHIGNGSSNAGAKKLHAMMDRIRKARTGNHKQGKQIKAEKFLPA
jgi:hypothetical protein